MKRLRRRKRQGPRFNLYPAAGLLILGCTISLLLYWQPSTVASIQRPRLTLPEVQEYVLKLNGAITASSAGAIIAVSDNLFLREGLDVQLRRGIDDLDVISSVADNDHVIGLASAQEFLKARAEGLPIVAFAASYVLSSVEFFGLSNTKLLGPEDLEGKRIGFKSGPEISTVLYAFIARNVVAQSGIETVESKDALSYLLQGKIDILIGHRDVEGQELEKTHLNYRSLSPDSFGVHTMGPVYIANERAFSIPDNLEKFLIAIANGWNAAYSDYNRTIPIIARSTDDGLSSAQLIRFMDAQRRFLRPSGTRFGELDPRQVKIVQGQLLQKRIIEQPIDLSSAVNYNILTEVYRAQSGILHRVEP